MRYSNSKNIHENIDLIGKKGNFHKKGRQCLEQNLMKNEIVIEAMMMGAIFLRKKLT